MAKEWGKELDRKYKNAKKKKKMLMTGGQEAT